MLARHGVDVRLVVTHRDDPGENLWFERVSDVADTFGIPWTAPDDANAPAFVERTGAANPFDGLDVAYYARPALADFDRDGDLDLVCGTETGRFRFFQNVGSATSPSFARGFGGGNPLDGEDVGDRAAPAAADLDGDGDADLVTGSLAGTFALHYFPEPARGWLLGAGIALISLFARLRRPDRR